MTDYIDPEPDPEAERVERVAMALCTSNVVGFGMEDYRRQARAAIAAYEAQP